MGAPPGFWCITITGGPLAGRTHCYRLEGTCARLYGEALAAKDRVTKCKPADRAVCFEMTDHTHQVTHYRCHPNLDDCHWYRNKVLTKNPDYVAGECHPAK